MFQNNEKRSWQNDTRQIEKGETIDRQSSLQIISEKRERNYGIDILRGISMLMVCILHIMNHGGILKNVIFGTSQFDVAWFFEIACFSAVNCYALISGFVGGSSKFKLSNLVYLWLQVAFLNGTISIGFAVFQGNLEPKVLLEFLPVLTRRFWYFNAYFGLFFLMPVLNAAIHFSKKRVLGFCLIGLFVLFSVVGYFRDLFQLEDGYSLIWLSYLYLVGGYISKYKPFAKIKTYLVVVFAALCILGPWVLKFWKNRDFFGYLCPAHVLFAVALLEIFSRIRIKTGVGKKMISFFASTSFGVYIIHDQKDIRGLLKFEKYTEYNAVKLALAILGTALAIYLACSAIDFLRLLLFKLIRVKPLLQKIESKIKNKLQRENYVSE